MKTYLEDITGTLGEWFDNGLDVENIPSEAVTMLFKVYCLCVNALDK